MKYAIGFIGLQGECQKYYYGDVLVVKEEVVRYLQLVKNPLLDVISIRYYEDETAMLREISDKKLFLADTTTLFYRNDDNKVA